MLRKVRFGEKLVDGLVMDHYAEFSEEVLRIIAKLVSRSKDQEMGLSCIVKIGRALDFLAFSAEIPQNNFAGMNFALAKPSISNEKSKTIFKGDFLSHRFLIKRSP